MAVTRNPDTDRRIAAAFRPKLRHRVADAQDRGTRPLQPIGGIEWRAPIRPLTSIQEGVPVSGLSASASGALPTWCHRDRSCLPSPVLSRTTTAFVGIAWYVGKCG